MAKVNGSAIVLQNGTTTIVGQTDATMTMTADMLDATTKDSTAKAKEYLPGETGWTFSISGLYDPAAASAGSVSKAITDLKAGTAWTAKWGQTTSLGNYWGGTIYISNVTVNGPKNDLANYSMEAQGTGVLTETSN